MKALITGSEGFVGRYLMKELEANGYDCVIGLDVRPGKHAVQADLLDAAQIHAILEAEKPDAIFHLAGQANVGRSWQIPGRTVELNVIAAVHVMDGMRAACPDARLVLVGSSDQYGQLGEAGALVSEQTPTQPNNPYAISKVAQENMAMAYARSYGLHICMTRSFNHGGAGQQPGFMIPDFASGIVKVERGEADCLRVGNLTSRRDFTHVKDVVRAYRLLADKGRPGEVYNIGSGEAYSAQEILDRLVAMASCPIPVQQDPARMRPSDTPIIRCDHSKLTAHTDWEPRYTLEDILRDTLTYYRSSKVEP